MDRAEEHSRSFSSAYEKDKSSSESSSLNSIRRRISMFGEKNIKSIQTQDADPRKSTPPPHIPPSTQFRSQMKRDNPELSSAIRTTCETGTHIKKRRKLNLFQKIDLSEDTDDKQLGDDDSIPISEHNSNDDAGVKEELQSTPPSSLSTQKQQQQTLPLQSLSHRKSIFDANRVKLESPEREFKSARKTLDGRYTKEREEFAVKEEPMSDNDDMDVTGGEAPGTPKTDRRLLLQRSGKKMEPKPFNTGNKRVSRVVVFPAELQRVKEEAEAEAEEEEEEKEDEEKVHNDNDDSDDDDNEDTNEESDNDNDNGNVADKVEVKKEDEEKRRIKNEKDPFIPSANGKIKNNFSFVPNRFSGISGARQPSPSSDQLKIAQQQQQQHHHQHQQLQQQQQQQLQQINPGYQVQQSQFPQQLRQQMQQAQFQQQHPQQIIGAQQIYPIQPQQAPQQFYGIPRVQQQPFYQPIQPQYYVNISQTPTIVNPMIKPDHLPFIEFINKRSVITVEKKSYLELEVIGRGASSCVKKVLGEDFKMYALKSVRCKEIGPEKLNEEVRLMEKLKTCNLVIAIIAHNIDDDIGHIVMELGDSDLSKLLADSTKKAIDFNLIRVYWKQMLDSVNAVHEEGIIHADLKPQNFVLVNGTLKLIDFGISKQMNQDSTHVTMGLGVGTPNYLSPEALNHGNFAESDTKARVTKAADTWSLGCILYQMAYGKSPFQDCKNNEKFNKIVSEKYKIPMPPTVERDGSIITLPPSLIDVLKRCLERDPKLRPSINELLNHPFLTGNTFCPHCISSLQPTTTPSATTTTTTTTSSSTTTGNNGKNNGKANEVTTTTTTTTNTTTNRTSTVIKGRTSTITKSSTTTKSSTSAVKASGVRSNVRGSSIKK